ncbi:TIM-barrel domain-containing protein [uncultured Acetobacteroides sp.]|uniref:TIM-barrel domain-containing protein n=1 Tax=uncultured Acetobacteroides sp. TaxID=1760811 RepID=UPI0029F58481|nr:TIM-barrel domain-containing protein [uncultured Acetobacteroides sp.]
MRRLIFSLAVLLPVVTLGFQGTKSSDGVTVMLKKKGEHGVRQIRLKVYADNIIRVTATPDAAFNATPSLIVDESARATAPFSVKEDKASVLLQTAKLTASVAKATGAVTFFDAKGKVLLQEKVGGEKSFAPITVENTNGYTIRQVFESPADEAFYGLGQHQSDEFNYKGKNETLFQYNTKVSNPVVQSNKGYGILWDCYSLTRFGDPRAYANLNQFNLYDANGKPGTLSALYYANGDTIKPMLVRSEASVDYENLTTITNFPDKFPFYNSKIVWKGKIEPKESGIFKFSLYYAGYTKVYVDNKEVVAERWRTAWNPNTYKFDMKLEKGKKYDIRLEWKPDGGKSYISLKALSPVAPKEQGRLSLWSEMANQIDYYFIQGANADEVVKGYRALTGKAPIMPKWAMGFWQSRERYKTADEILGVIKEYRKRSIPLDNIVLDWSYWPENAWGSHEFEKSRFPDPKQMIDDVHGLNAHIMISVWPKFYATTQHYKEFDSKGWMYKQAIKDSILDWIGNGYLGSFYDAYNADARKLFWNQMNEHIYSKGMDAWWMDASEPDILSNSSIEYRKKLMTPTALGSSTQYFNTYALMNAMAIYNGQRSVDANKRVFLLTRSGFAGLQKYSTAVWSGDIGTRWEDMKAQISAGLNFAIAGIPYWTMDIGGFCVEHRYEVAKEGSEDLEEWRELNTRWLQFGAFCPLFRVHGQYPYREIYNLAPETHPAYQSMVYYDKLRYRLMPYIYTLAGKTFFDDYTIMRALVMDYASDHNVLTISDQYMFGSALMVCPVYKYKQRERSVYFPSGNGWYDFYTGTFTDGGQTKAVAAPYGLMPLFAKEGSIIPVGPAVQYAAEKSSEPITLMVYTGKDATFRLYNDDGTSYGYQNGHFSTIDISYNEKDKTLTIGNRQGEYPEMQKNIRFNIVWVGKQTPKTIESPADEQIEYDGNKVVVLVK